MVKQLFWALALHLACCIFLINHSTSLSPSFFIY
jgi:hypothetical protein